MKFLVEDSQSILEAVTQGDDMFIEGFFAMAEQENRNKRVYPKEVLEEALDSYMNDVKNSKALGELNHPDYPFPDPAMAAIKIEELFWQGDNVYGKARVLNTSRGKEVKALLEGGVKLGVSTRGLGELDAQRRVLPGFQLNAIDVVHKPSAQVCEMNVVNESEDWVNENGVWKKTSDHVITESEIDRDSVVSEIFTDLFKDTK